MHGGGGRGREGDGGEVKGRGGERGEGEDICVYVGRVCIRGREGGRVGGRVEREEKRGG